MDERTEQEARLFVRYEARIVRVEEACDACHEWRKKYGQIVDELKVGDEIARAVAKRLKEERTFALTRVQFALAFAALCVPPVLTAVLVKVLGKG